MIQAVRGRWPSYLGSWDNRAVAQTEAGGSPSVAVAERVRHWRKERGLNQQQHAERLAEQGTPIGNTGLSRLERGERRITVEDLCALARALHVSPVLLLSPPDTLRVGDGTLPQPWAAAGLAGATGAGQPDRPDQIAAAMDKLVDVGQAERERFFSVPIPDGLCWELSGPETEIRLGAAAVVTVRSEARLVPIVSAPAPNSTRFAYGSD